MFEESLVWKLGKGGWRNRCQDPAPAWAQQGLAGGLYAYQRLLPKVCSGVRELEKLQVGGLAAILRPNGVMRFLPLAFMNL